MAAFDWNGAVFHLLVDVLGAKELLARRWADGSQYIFKELRYRCRGARD